MADIAKVTVAKDALSSLQESINIGKEVLQRKLSAYQKKIVELEKAKEMDTDWGSDQAKILIIRNNQ